MAAPVGGSHCDLGLGMLDVLGMLAILAGLVMLAFLAILAVLDYLAGDYFAMKVARIGVKVSMSIPSSRQVQP